VIVGGMVVVLEDALGGLRIDTTYAPAGSGELGLPGEFSTEASCVRAACTPYGSQGLLPGLGALLLLRRRR
jgi:hypothetical protein